MKKILLCLCIANWTQIKTSSNQTRNSAIIPPKYEYVLTIRDEIDVQQRSEKFLTIKDTIETLGKSVQDTSNFSLLSLQERQQMADDIIRHIIAAQALQISVPYTAESFSTLLAELSNTQNIGTQSYNNLCKALLGSLKYANLYNKFSYATDKTYDNCGHIITTLIQQPNIYDSPALSLSHECQVDLAKAVVALARNSEWYSPCARALLPALIEINPTIKENFEVRHNATWIDYKNHSIKFSYLNQ